MAPATPLKVGCLTALAVSAQALGHQPRPIEYKHVVLGSSSFNATVFLPASSPSDKVYYNATRFDWSTQIGNIRIGDYLLFASDYWGGAPHNPSQLDAGVGLAAEWGCGDAGATCANQGFTNHPPGAANGVLGFEEAKENGTFVKVGVGKLIRTGDTYSPFQPYEFAEYPTWMVQRSGKDMVKMQQEVVLNEKWGYQLETTIRVVESSLQIKTTLTNLGTERIRSPHYSHNFLDIDRTPSGPPWRLFMVPNASDFAEPGVRDGWAKPAQKFFDVEGTSFVASKTMKAGDKVKVVFQGAQNAIMAATWTALHKDLTITNTETNEDPKLFAYNFYAEETTLSPETMSMVVAEPHGQPKYSSTFSRTISFHVKDTDLGSVGVIAPKSSVGNCLRGCRPGDCRACSVS